MRVAIRELKAGLSRLLSQAQSGAVIEVTSHNRPVARIVGIPPEGSAGVARLLTSGAAAWAGGKPALEEPLVLGPGGTPVGRMILEDRR